MTETHCVSGIATTLVCEVRAAVKLKKVCSRQTGISKLYRMTIGEGGVGGVQGRKGDLSVLTRCCVCREGAVPLRCWRQRRSGDRMRRSGGCERDVGRREEVEGRGKRGRGGEKGERRGEVTKKGQLIKQTDSLMDKHYYFL